MNAKHFIFLVLGISFALMFSMSCNRDNDNDNNTPEDTLAVHLTYIPPATQQSGEPARLATTLIYGNYISKRHSLRLIGTLLAR